MNKAEHNQLGSEQSPKRTANKVPTKTVAIVLTEQEHTSDEGADESKKTDGRRLSVGWGAGTN